MKRVGILYHPMLSAAGPLAQELAARLEALSVAAWVCSAWEEEEARNQVAGSDLLLSIGGDGTILRAARIAVPWPVPILGVNMGRLGFMTELSAAEVRQRLPDIVSGMGWLDERAMLEVELSPGEEHRRVFHALNDAVVGRGALARTVELQVRVDGETVSSYKADGIILATATGSTGYSLAAGGPILYPQSREIMVQPLLAHLVANTALVLSPSAKVEVEIRSSSQASLSIDGQIDLPLKDGDLIQAAASLYQTRFLRLQPPGYFYRTLAQRLSGR
ncbi:MAG: NAD(+)/NADH kinase [Chloroflexi bacterium]|nr:NAD(+)/NADH kinase [Chloroflexota bacterium]